MVFNYVNNHMTHRSSWIDSVRIKAELNFIVSFKKEEIISVNMRNEKSAGARKKIVFFFEVIVSHMTLVNEKLPV